MTVPTKEKHTPPLHCDLDDKGNYNCRDPQTTIVQYAGKPLSSVMHLHYLHFDNGVGSNTIMCKSADTSNRPLLHCYLNDQTFGGRVYEGDRCVHFHFNGSVPGVPVRLNLCHH